MTETFTYEGVQFDSLWNMVSYRTAARIKAGKYQAPPCELERYLIKGAHLSTVSKGMLAYYPSDESALRDIPNRIRPGRYLKKVFPDMDDDEIRRLVSLLNADIGTYSLKFFDQGKDMIEVYQALHENGTVISCLSDPDLSEGSNATHPLMVYDESDVQLAVLVDQRGCYRARALVSKITKQYPMIYGHWEVMALVLDKYGYTHGDLSGCEIKAIQTYFNEETRIASFVMPYIDGHRSLSRCDYRASCVSYNGYSFTICEEGDYSTSTAEFVLHIEF